MSRLDPFERAKVSLKAGEILSVQAAGTTNVQVLEGGPLGTTAVVGAVRTFGPYPAPARLLVECVSGEAEYGLSDYQGALTGADVQALQLVTQGFDTVPGAYAYLTKYYTHAEVGPDGSTPVSVTAPANMTHDLVANAPNGLIDPITGKSFAAFQTYVGQPLAPIPGATSAPYWTDAGQITHNANANNIPASYPGLIDYVRYKDRWTLRLRCPAGYGDAAGNGKRRSQIRLPPIGNRGTYHWRIAFEIPAEDEPCYDAATKYAFPILFWQIIGTASGSEPLFSFMLETTADPNVFRLLARFRWSGDSTTSTPTYRRQNGSNTGTSAPKDDIYLCNVAVQRGREYKLDVVIYLDERGDATTVYGWAKAWLDGVKIIDYAGPTYYCAGTAAATAGTLSSVHCTLYRFGYSRMAQLEGGNPTGFNELDLNRQTDPAPYTRVLHFYEWRMRKVA